MGLSTASGSGWEGRRSRSRWAALPQQNFVTNVLLGGVIFLLWANLYFIRSQSMGLDDVSNTNPLISGFVPHFQRYTGADGIPSSPHKRYSTLVIYVYNAVDEQQQRNFAFFLRYGIAENGPTYRIVVTQGPGVLDFPRLPSLPANAAYLKTQQCTTTWGAIDAVMLALPIVDHEHFVVLDASVRGPFLPPYMQGTSADQGGAQHALLHWTEAYTSRLTAHVKLVGAWVSCEGAPRWGNAAADWRGNPYVSPSIWATDAAGWKVLAAKPGVFRCHTDPWDTRYFSDAGASLTILEAGWGLDSLLTRYQGVDWTRSENWQCNQRVRPEFELHYDGISITPYETVFVPVSNSMVAAKWSFVEAAARYEEWMDNLLRPLQRRPGVQRNGWIARHWEAKAEKLVYMNARGPECFEFALYAKTNPDVAEKAADDLALWEHFVLIGQFQGRPHAFTCPFQVGGSYRVSYLMSRGPRCFDHAYYAEQHADLERAGITSQNELFLHFVEFGQFEKRKARFTCADTLTDLVGGFDTLRPGEHLEGAVGGQQRTAAETAAREAQNERSAILRQLGDANNALQQAVKGALLAEAVKEIGKKGPAPTKPKPEV